MSDYICTICNTKFKPESEGGIVGDVGILPAAFCPTCRAGLWDLHEQLRLPVVCLKCGWSEDDENAALKAVAREEG